MGFGPLLSGTSSETDNTEASGQGDDRSWFRDDLNAQVIEERSATCEWSGIRLNEQHEK